MPYPPLVSLANTEKRRGGGGGGEGGTLQTIKMLRSSEGRAAGPAEFQLLLNKKEVFVSFLLDQTHFIISSMLILGIQQQQ